VTSLDCCTGFACNGSGFCVQAARASGANCHYNGDCSSNACVIPSSACYGTCQ
jgi:hypothetical protein